MLEDYNTVAVSRAQLVPAVCQTREDVIRYIREQQVKAEVGSGTRACYDTWLPYLEDTKTYAPDVLQMTFALEYARLHRLLADPDVQDYPMLSVHITDYETTLYFVEMKCVQAKVVEHAY